MIANSDQSISWTGFQMALIRYEIENASDFWDYMGIIKHTIANFDRIYNIKTNTPEVQQMNSLIESYKRKGNKNE